MSRAIAPNHTRNIALAVSIIRFSGTITIETAQNYHKSHRDLFSCPLTNGQSSGQTPRRFTAFIPVIFGGKGTLPKA